MNTNVGTNVKCPVSWRINPQYPLNVMDCTIGGSLPQFHETCLIGLKP